MATSLGTKNYSIDHAKHNESVCEYLDTPKDKHDWVITTAFYSALHYARHKIFPYNMEIRPNKRELFQTFDDYFSYYHSLYPNVNKHEAMKKLIRREIQSIADDYDHLFSMCHTARYVDYNLASIQARVISRICC